MHESRTISSQRLPILNGLRFEGLRRFAQEVTCKRLHVRGVARMMPLSIVREMTRSYAVVGVIARPLFEVANTGLPESGAPEAPVIPPAPPTIVSWPPVGKACVTYALP